MIAIAEGPKRYLAGVDFKGNVYATDAMLHTKISGRERLFGLLFGKFHRDVLDEDVRKLKEYYYGQGFHEVKITPVTRNKPDDIGAVLVEFDISEGVRYRVRNISFEGNQRIKTDDLRKGMNLHSDQPMIQTVADADQKTLIGKYYALGCIDTQILPEKRYTDEPGVVDLVYRIQEGEPFRVGNIQVQGNDRTRDKVVRRETAMAGLLPGEPLDGNRLELARQRLVNLGYFTTAPDNPSSKPLELKMGLRHPPDKPYGDTATAADPLAGVSRMQGPDMDPRPPPRRCRASRKGSAAAAPRESISARRRPRPPRPVRSAARDESSIRKSIPRRSRCPSPPCRLPVAFPRPRPVPAARTRQPRLRSGPANLPA